MMYLLILKHTNNILYVLLILGNNIIMKNIINKKIIFGFIIIVSILLFHNTVKASAKKEGIENFPEDYRSYLYELKSRYPNWSFIALYTGLDWNYTIRTRKYIWEKFSTKIIF